MLGNGAFNTEDYPSMTEQEITSHELLVELTLREINLWRLALGKASSEEEAGKASRLFLKSVRERGCRYSVRELGRSYNAAI
jgi:hypothetical protein